jgi:hypothetical protein
MFNNLLSVNCFTSLFFISLYGKINKISNFKLGFVIYIYVSKPAFWLFHLDGKEFTVSTPLGEKF